MTNWTVHFIQYKRNKWKMKTLLWHQIHWKFKSVKNYLNFQRWKEAEFQDTKIPIKQIRKTFTALLLLPVLICASHSLVRLVVVRLVFVHPVFLVLISLSIFFPCHCLPRPDAADMIQLCLVKVCSPVTLISCSQSFFLPFFVAFCVCVCGSMFCSNLLTKPFSFVFFFPFAVFVSKLTDIATNIKLSLTETWVVILPKKVMEKSHGSKMFLLTLILSLLSIDR